MTASTIRLRRWLAGLALLLALPATSAVAQDFELPPVDEVFVLSAQATAPDRIEVRWRALLQIVGGDKLIIPFC
ncbi:hypothetical protein SL904_25040 [Klebsiella pneumoniae]